MIGDMNKRATLLENSFKTDSAGNTADNWQAYASVWATLIWQGYRIKTVADVSKSIASYTIAIRRRTDTEPNQRISFEGRLFEIVAINDEGSDKSFVHLICEEIQG